MKLIIVDSHYIAHRTKHALKGLTYAEKQTGVIYGFLNSVKSLWQKFKPCQFVFTWDSELSLRREIYPEYKNKKSKEQRKPEDVALDVICMPQFPIIRDEVLKTLGFRNIFRKLGYEADDIIASIVKERDDPKNTIVISRDNDLWQLLKHTQMWNPDDKKYLNEKKFTNIHGIKPKQWEMVKCLAGCDGDNVSGIDRCSYITATRYLLDSIPHHHKVYQNIERGKKEIIKRNRKLVVLPFEGVGSFHLREDKLSLEGFIEVCMQYDFKYWLSNLKPWKDMLK